MLFRSIAYAREFIRGLDDARVLGCGKHFPGLGRATLDSHFDLPEVQATLPEMARSDLLLYRELRRELPFVMVAHASYPEVTKNQQPASLSPKWMQDVLRKKIGYRGLIISDDLEMGGVLSTGTIEDVAVETLRAGADMFLVCHNQELVWRGYEAVVHAAERDRKFAAHVARAAERVLAFKKRSKELHGFAAEPTTKVVDKLKRIMSDFTRIVGSPVIDDRLHLRKEINV